MFGGIILMAVLVVLLTQARADTFSSRLQEENGDAADTRELRHEMLAMENAVVGLKEKALRAQVTYEARVPPAVDTMLVRREVMQNAFKKAARHLEDVRKRISDEATFLATSPGQRSDLERVLAAHQAERDRLNDLLRVPVALRAQVRLPHHRSAIAGQAEYFIIKGAQTYYVGYRHRGHAHLHVEDLSDLALPTVAAIYEQPIKIQPKDGAGLPVPENVEQSAPWLQRMSRYSSSEHYLVFFVWNDSGSFAAFQRLKNSALAKKFQYVVRIQVPDSGSITVEPTRLHEAE